jgi:curved DNA-binding protein CbpA
MSHLYGVLGIAANADRTEVKAAFRRLAKKCHPDLRGGDVLRFREVNEAYTTLIDPVRRSAYDARCEQRRACAQRRLMAGAATMAASFAMTVGSGMAVAGWLLGA